MATVIKGIRTASGDGYYDYNSLANKPPEWTQEEKDKLAGIQSGAQVNKITSVNGQEGEIQLTASDVGAFDKGAMIILKSGIHYGDDLPEEGNPGRIFFKKVT